jgi:hypothetical protein
MKTVSEGELERQRPRGSRSYTQSWGVGRAAAGESSRKVRTPKGRVLGNAQAGRPAESATESRPPPRGGKGETVR